jgi:ribosomal protein S18 acetylase RimI-like enzyme
MDHVLDNPIWHALTGPHQSLATGHGLARHYPRRIASYSAVREPSATAFEDLRISLPEGPARLIRAEDGDAPPGWRTISGCPLLQMVVSAEDRPEPRSTDAAIVPIGMDDIDDIMALITATKPGPFAPQTPTLGLYIGIRAPETGALIAMAGERLRPPGYVELSAVAVDPHHRGKGYAGALLATLVDMAFSRGDVPFLHVLPDNPAIKLYQNLGFRARRCMTLSLWELSH